MKINGIISKKYAFIQKVILLIILSLKTKKPEINPGKFLRFHLHTFLKSLFA
ncbi:hypothetical protein Ataiwa_21950 [Algoriphagus taiwanensis]|uniref:Uncharacterized protein n=1 Tax=Algoriphagus taiwanensis TaxID=1445656 RepID=A0ABQ6Q369_9BACT|nr:hypothetical protein Ataiwa_21950 [Algoriphagus taiwanensis]